MKATAVLCLVIASLVFARAQKTETTTFTFQSEIRPKTPFSTDGLSLAFPTVGLFIGISDYGENAKVPSTPAHTLGAAIMYEAFNDAATRSENQALGMPEKNYLSAGKEAICALVFSPDGSYFASGSKDGTVTLWSATKPGEVVSASQHKTNACALAFSPNSSLLVTGDSGGEAVVQHLRADQTPITLKQPAGVCSVAFSPGGSKILTTALDGTTRIWDPAGTREPLALPPEQDCPPAKPDDQSCADGPVAAFGPNDNTVVTSTCGAVRLWNLDKPGQSTLLGKEASKLSSVSLSPDGSKVLTATDDEVALWQAGDTSGEQQPRRFPNGRYARFSPDGARIFVGEKSGFVKHYGTPNMTEEKVKLGAVGTNVNSLEFSQDGNFILVRSKAGSAWMQNIDGAKRAIQVPRPDREGDQGMNIAWAIDRGGIPPGRKRAAIEAVAFSPDASYVVAGYNDGSIGIHPGINISSQKSFRRDNQFLLADLKFDKSATSIMSIWYLEQLHGASQNLSYHPPDDASRDTDDASFLRLGRGEPVTRKRIFDVLSAVIARAEQTAASTQDPTLLVVYVAAHGWIGSDGRQYFLPSDADKSNPATWIAYEDFIDPIRNFLLYPEGGDGRRWVNFNRGAIVIFDTCQTRLDPSQDTLAESSKLDPKNLNVVEATSPGEYAWHWTGNLDSQSWTTTNKSTSKFGITHHSGPKESDTKSEYSARMSMFPFASQWALNAFIKDRASRASPEEREISLSDWIAVTQEGITSLQKNIPDVKESGHEQMVRIRYPDQDVSVFRVDKNAPPQ